MLVVFINIAFKILLHEKSALCSIAHLSTNDIRFSYNNFLGRYEPTSVFPKAGHLWQQFQSFEITKKTKKTTNGHDGKSNDCK